MIPGYTPKWEEHRSILPGENWLMALRCQHGNMDREQQLSVVFYEDTDADGRLGCAAIIDGGKPFPDEMLREIAQRLSTQLANARRQARRNTDIRLLAENICKLVDEFPASWYAKKERCHALRCIASRARAIIGSTTPDS